MLFTALAFGQANNPQPNSAASAYNDLAGFRRDQIAAENENAKKAQAILIVSVIVAITIIVIVVIRVKRHKEYEKEVAIIKANSPDIIPRSIPLEHIKRVTELIEQGMERDTIFQTLRSEGWVGKEISDAYYSVYHKYLEKQEQT